MVGMKPLKVRDESPASFEASQQGPKCGPLGSTMRFCCDFKADTPNFSGYVAYP
jgi:hypothetical protein